MMQNTSSCCCRLCEPHDGYLYCTECGKLQNQILETSSTSFQQRSYFMPRGYTRRSRFVKKVLGSLRLLATHNVDGELLAYLKEQNIQNPEELLAAISKYHTKGRRPYQFAMYYWKALGKPVPRCTEQDIDLLVREFDEILFAWERHRFKKPKFPYSFLFRKIVAANPRYTDGIRKFIPFVRKLRCQQRRERYEKLFNICNNFEYKNVRMIYETNMDEKTDEVEPSSKGQEIFYREICSGKRKSVYDVQGIYKSQREIDDAVKRGDFNIAKTMHVGKNGEFYFLCYQDGDYVKNKANLETEKQKPVSVRKMQVQDTQSLELSPAQKLDKMLRDQSNA